MPTSTGFGQTRKNGEEDIRKAEWYESKLIELEGDKMCRL